MQGGYEDHFESVATAQREVQDLQGLISMTMEKREQVTGAVVHAVGENPSNASASNALALMGEIQDMLDRILGMCESARTELTEYSRSF